MKTRLLPLLPLLLLHATADTIRLRDGKEYEGVVLREEGDVYVVAVQVTKSIRDERRIPKTDVLEIVSEKKDDVAFEAIKSLVPTPDLLEASDYVSRINRIERFMETHNSSRHLSAADKMLDELDKERKVVDAGGIKFEGKMIEAADRAARAYPLDARIAATKVERLANDRDLIGALRAWENLQKTFVGSQAYRDTIPFAITLMNTQLANVSRLLDSYDSRAKEREDGLQRMPDKDRSRAEQVLAAESAAFARLLEEERKASERWTSLSPWHKESLQSTKSRLEQEIKRLQGLDTSKLPDADAAWTSAWETLSGTVDSAGAQSVLSAARSAQLPDTYLKMLEKKAPAK